MKKLIINGRFLTLPMTGINRFAYELVKQLSKIRHCEIVVPRGLLLESQYDISGLNVVEFGKLKSHLWEQWSLWRYARKNKGALLLSLSGIGPIFFYNKIITIHDLSFLHNPKWFSKTYYLLYKILTPIAIKSSQLILTVSNFSKSEIKNYYSVDDSRIEVIYNAVERPKMDKILTQKFQYVLTVGSLDPRKNLKTLIEAFGDERLRNIELHIVGSNNRVFNSLGINYSHYPNVKVLGRLSDEELYKEYQNAFLFISSSLYEGFGIPPLEALSFSIPILVSDIPVYREIYEDAATYFDPLSKEEIIISILNQLAHKDFDNSLANKILSKFNWNLSAQKIDEIITKL